jgi:hypothetical protein
MTAIGSIISALAEPAGAVVFLLGLTISTLICAVTRSGSASSSFYYVVSGLLIVPAVLLCAYLATLNGRSPDPSIGIFIMFGVIPIYVVAAGGWLCGLLAGLFGRAMIPHAEVKSPS